MIAAGGRSSTGSSSSNPTVFDREVRLRLTSLYATPPSRSLALTQFGDLGAERLTILKKLEHYDSSTSSSLSGGPRIDGDSPEAGKDVARLIQRYYLDSKALSATSATGDGVPITAEEKDYASHYILKLVMCRNLECRTWFLKYETMLFRHKFKALSTNDQTKFLRTNGLMGDDCSPLTASEWEDNAAGIRKAHQSASSSPSNYVSHASTSSEVVERRNFYKVRFQMVPDVIASRTVYVKGGWAFVPRSKLLKMVSDVFRMKLSKGLAAGQTKIATLLQGEERQRLGPIIKHLERKALGFQNVGTDPKSAKEVIDNYLHYLKSQGYSDPKLKETQKYPGSDKHFLMVGYRKANDKDKTCPFAGRVHKSNTQRFCVHVKQKVMVQRCWDGLCEGGMHFYQIVDGKIRALKDTPPQILSEEDMKKEAEAKKNGTATAATPSATVPKVAPVFDKTPAPSSNPAGVSPDKAVQ